MYITLPSFTDDDSKEVQKKFIISC